YFFRCAFSHIRYTGAFGLIATNTIAQGDTRTTGLGWLRANGAIIFAARRRVLWPIPGAAVIVSAVHVAKRSPPRECHLDGRPVPRITAFLFDRGGDCDPARLSDNSGRAFIGSYAHSMGFTFDDENNDVSS